MGHLFKLRVCGCVFLAMGGGLQFTVVIESLSKVIRFKGLHVVGGEGFPRVLPAEAI